ncbi:MAG: hypothetical protein ACJAT1_001321 [Marivirga sp.]|jgi:hypothetical protein
MNIKRLLHFFLLALIILLIPFIGMQISDEVNWGVFDFLIAGILLLSAAIGAELILSTIKTLNIRLISLLIFIALFLLIWAELAVGIFGSPFAGS